MVRLIDSMFIKEVIKRVQTNPKEYEVEMLGKLTLALYKIAREFIIRDAYDSFGELRGLNEYALRQLDDELRLILEEE